MLRAAILGKSPGVCLKAFHAAVRISWIAGAHAAILACAAWPGELRFAGGARMASLLILKGPNPNTRIPLDRDRTVLGRNNDCDVVINVPAVSREHARIIRRDGKFFIEDLRSRNGTAINNQTIETEKLFPLNDNDKIKICDFQCSFHDPERKPLPPELGGPDDEPEEDQQDSSTVEASLSHSSHLMMETQSTERLRAVLDISSKLRKTLELDDLLPKILEKLFDLFRQADRGFLILQEEATGKLIPKVIRTRRPADESNARFSRSIVRQCLEKVEGFLSDDASSDSRFSLAQSIADFRIRSVMCAPLWTSDGKAFGVIQLDTQDRSKKFAQDDLALLLGVASQASIALENAKLHEDQLAQVRLRRDLELANAVQRSFLPQRLPQVPGYSFFAHYEAAQEVGGDYYGFIPLSNDKIVVALGDVAGKGVPAALLMAKLSSDARFCLLTEPDAKKAINKLNDLLVPQTSQMDRFVTLVAAVVDASTHAVTLASAGHQSPLLYRKEKNAVQDAMSNDVVGLPLGVMDGVSYEACQIKLEPGDFLVAFTDGVTDAKDRNEVAFGAKGLNAVMKEGPFTPQAIGERLVKAVKLHAAGCKQYDDITVVCFGRN
jgi:serine phosphatase RsbU (regulator of sigma subunit)/pSer/pThr/pTyr-binding forkhead associated (FHA) protein